MNDKILQDLSSTGKVRPWREHKMSNELLAFAYDEVDIKKAERLRSCVNQLSFSVSPDGKKKLAAAWFCRVRLCPVCSWRRSLKVAAQMRAIMAAIKKDKPCAYIMLTLTQANCTPDQLGSEIDRILRGFGNMMQLTDVESAVLGWYRALEITHNVVDDTYHPHFHCIFAVRPSYFSSKQYIRQSRWTELWQHAIGLDYTPVVHVQRVKGDTTAAVAEAAKYAVKSGDYIMPNDWQLTVDTVRLLNDVLHKRRFIALGGLLKQWHKKLHLEEADTGDLVHVDPDEKPDMKGDHLINFAWFSGYRQYHAT